MQIIEGCSAICDARGGGDGYVGCSKVGGCGVGTVDAEGFGCEGGAGCGTGAYHTYHTDNPESVHSDNIPHTRCD